MPPSGMPGQGGCGPIRVASVASGSPGYHVAKTGSDSNSGSEASPWLTIQHALDNVSAGETITVHAGTYREELDPPTGEFTLRAAVQGEAVIKGSERVTGWTSLGSGRWQVVLADAFFGGYNPFNLYVDGSYMLNPNTWKRGQIYVNDGPAMTEVASAGSTTSAGLWASSYSSGNTTITAHFDALNPNTEIVELAVRAHAFAPTTAYLADITLEGLEFAQCAPNWTHPADVYQPAIIASAEGRDWVIERCRVRDSRCCGISLGRSFEPVLGSEDIYEEFGPFPGGTIRYCTIERCGQSGIIGVHGRGAVIEHNLIQDINGGPNELNGYENGAIKLHQAIDVVIRRNILRRVWGTPCYGIWLDYISQGSQITGNVIYEIDSGVAIFLEKLQGPTGIFNNVLVGNTDCWGRANIFAHNMIAGTVGGSSTGDNIPWYGEHTAAPYIGISTIAYEYARHFNNIYVTSYAPVVGGTDIGSRNVVWDGGSILSGQTDCLSSGNTTGLTITDSADGCTVEFNADSLPTTVACTVISSTTIGAMNPSGARMENPDGTDITLNTDALGNARDSSPTAGPFETLTVGANEFEFTAGWEAP